MTSKLILLAAAPVAGLALAALASAGGTDDDYGYPGGTGGATTTVTTGAGTTTAASATEGVTTYRSALTTGQEVPRPKGVTAARGVFSATVTDKGGTATIRWTLTFGGLTGRAVAAHVHLGRRGQAGDVVQALCGPCRNGQSRTMRLSPAARDAIESGRAYVNVHTAKNAAGEIRGQLAKGAHLYGATLNVAQEVPRPQGAAGAKGTFTARVALAGGKATLRWKLSFSGLTGSAVAAHVHKGRKGKAGDVLAALCGPCSSGRSGSVRLSDDAVEAIASGAAYVNVHTAANQAGEVRGQLALVR